MSNILITGADSGFGLLAARKFAEAGHTVHAGCRSRQRADDLHVLGDQIPLIRPLQLRLTDWAAA